MSFKLIKQHDIKDCGAACLSMVSAYFGLRLPMAKFRELIKVDNNGANVYGLVKGAEQIGFCATALKGLPEEFIEDIVKGEVKLPIVARVIVDGKIEHFVVVYKISGRYIYVADPGSGKKKIYIPKIFSNVDRSHSNI